MTAAGPVRRSPVAVELDPPGRPARIGLIALSTDLTSERDALRALPPDRVALHVSRIPFENPTTPETLRRMEPRLTEAADLIVPGVDLAAIIFSCTAASATIGDEPVAAAIGAARPGVPVVTPPGAAREAFAALGARRVALLTPYLVETTEPLAAYFEGQGLTIVAAQCLGIADDREMARVSERTIFEAARTIDTAAAEALFISCTALPAFALVDRMEAALGMPVVTSNQATFWRALHHAGVAPVSGAPGALFAHAPKQEAVA